MQIGEFAAATGTTPRMLRHYESQGLLTPAGRSPNGYREYGENQITAARQVNALIQAGLPSRLVKDLLGAVSDTDGIHPQHVDTAMINTVEGEWERMCRCVDCMAQRRDALRDYLDQLSSPERTEN
ncbi:MAG: MerR family DNA-binding transcriptional regulator [Propionibacteriales bacterium]|nr:MerR family DNA-binding transcriptional regulator [Propionibacteriales bacterium]